MIECLFCSMVAKKIPVEIIYEDETTLSFLDVNPLAQGHALVIPKMHAETVLELSEKEVHTLFSAVKEVTRKIQGGLHPDGFTIGINHGKKAGQAIDHMHVHIIPRFEGDGGTSMHGVVHNPPEEDLQKTAERIRIKHS